MTEPTQEWLYHATAVDNLIAILDEGLNNRESFDNLIYLANKQEYAAGFMRLHLKPSCVVFAVKADMLDHNLLSLSGDHNPAFFPEDLQSWAYAGVIPPEAFGTVTQYEFTDVPELTPEQMELLRGMST